MTGPEHYQAAEELLADITNDDGTVGFGEGGEAFVAAAQVHATLALAAATALMDVDQNAAVQGLPGRDHAAWREVAAAKDGA